MGLDVAFGYDTMWVIPGKNMNSGSEVGWTFLVGLSSKISPACVKLSRHPDCFKLQFNSSSTCKSSEMGDFYLTSGNKLLKESQQMNLEETPQILWLVPPWIISTPIL